MRAAIHAGASMVNDVNALQAEGALQVVAKALLRCASCTNREAANHAATPSYQDVVDEVCAFLRERVSLRWRQGFLRRM